LAGIAQFSFRKLFSRLCFVLLHFHAVRSPQTENGLSTMPEKLVLQLDLEPTPNANPNANPLCNYIEIL